MRWDQVWEYMHLERVLKPKTEEKIPQPVQRYRSLSIDDRELEAIMEREFGPIQAARSTGRSSRTPL